MLCAHVYTCILREIKTQWINRQHKKILYGKPENLTLEGQLYPPSPTYGVSKNLSSRLFDTFLESEPLGNSYPFFFVLLPAP